MDFKFGTNQYSSWVNYPELYKFYSIHFQLSQDIQKIERHKDDLFQLASGIGGVFIVLNRVFGFIVR
jgi:hypothetical protein